MENLYMLAIMPPFPLEARISEERITFAEKYNCKKALKPPVHITLCEPFKFESVAEERIKGLLRWAEKQAPIDIELRNYNFFKNPQYPVIYIDVVKNDPLNSFRKKLIEQVKHYIPIEAKANSFSPHFTIGYRDVSPKIFPAIMEEYSKKRFQGSFTFDTIYFWKHNGTNWETLYAFPLTGKIENTQQQSLF